MFYNVFLIVLDLFTKSTILKKSIIHFVKWTLNRQEYKDNQNLILIENLNIVLYGIYFHSNFFTGLMKSFINCLLDPNNNNSDFVKEFKFALSSSNFSVQIISAT